MEWGHKEVESRIGKDGWVAEVGDVVKVVKGRKYEHGLKFVISDKPYFNFNGYPGYHDERMLEFYDWNGVNYISPDNVVIVAQRENRKDDPEYANVRKVEVYS